MRMDMGMCMDMSMDMRMCMNFGQATRQQRGDGGEVVAAGRRGRAAARQRRRGGASHRVKSSIGRMAQPRSRTEGCQLLYAARGCGGSRCGKRLPQYDDGVLVRSNPLRL